MPQRKATRAQNIIEQIAVLFSLGRLDNLFLADRMVA